MDIDVIEYLRKEKPSEYYMQENRAMIYERQISRYCTSTVMTQVTWGMMPITIEDEQHYDEL